MELNFSYGPRPAQSILLADTSRFRVILGHRRFGKTFHCINELIIDGMKSLKKPGHFNLAYLAPTYSQAKRIAWGVLKDITKDFPDKGLWKAKWNESELKFTFGCPSSSFTIYLLGTDNYDALRGLGLYRTVFDEFADMNHKVWDEVILPMTLDFPDSRVTFIGTPKGKNRFWELYEEAQFKPGWSRYKFDLYESGVFRTDKEAGLSKEIRHKLLDEGKYHEHTVESIEEEYKQKPEAFNQEFKLYFEASVKGAIYLPQITAARNTGRVKSMIIDNRVTVNTAWDIGMDDDTAIIFYQMVGDEIRIIDTYSNRGQVAAHYANYLNQWRQNHGVAYDRHFLPHDLKVREWVTGSREQSLIELGIRPTLVAKTSLDDGIDAVRQLLPRVVFKSETTEELLEALSQYRREYDVKNGVYKAKPVHDKFSHLSDAMRYLAQSLPANGNRMVSVVAEGGETWNP